MARTLLLVMMLTLWASSWDDFFWDTVVKVVGIVAVSSAFIFSFLKRKTPVPATVNYWAAIFFNRITAGALWFAWLMWLAFDVHGSGVGLFAVLFFLLYVFASYMSGYWMYKKINLRW